MRRHSSLFAGVWYGGKRDSEGQNKVLYPGELPVIVQKGCFGGMVSRLVLHSPQWLVQFNLIHRLVCEQACEQGQIQLFTTELIDTEFSFINNVRGWMV